MIGWRSITMETPVAPRWSNGSRVTFDRHVPECVLVTGNRMFSLEDRETLNRRVPREVCLPVNNAVVCGAVR